MVWFIEDPKPYIEKALFAYCEDESLSVRQVVQRPLTVEDYDIGEDGTIIFRGMHKHVILLGSNIPCRLIQNNVVVRRILTSEIYSPVEIFDKHFQVRPISKEISKFDIRLIGIVIERIGEVIAP